MARKGIAIWIVCALCSFFDSVAAQTCTVQTPANPGWVTAPLINFHIHPHIRRATWQELKAMGEAVTERWNVATGSYRSYSLIFDGCFDAGAVQYCSWDYTAIDQFGNPESGDSGAAANFEENYYCPASGYAPVWPPSGAPYCEVVNVNLRDCPTDVKPDKERGCNKDGVMEGNPCNVGTGNKFQVEVDYSGIANSHLRYARYYNSDSTTPVGSHAKQWRGSFDRQLLLSSDGSLYSYNGAPAIFMVREDGRVIQFMDGSPITPKDSSTVEKLVQVDQLTWDFTDEHGNVETYKAWSGTAARLTAIRFADGRSLSLTYSSSGALSVVADEFGHKLTFTYNAAGRITKFTDPANKAHTYTYNAGGYLTKVTYPDTKFRQYTYGAGANAGLLMGIIDEGGVTYASWTYDTSQRVTSSQHAGGASAITIGYNSDGSRTVTDSLGSVRTYQFDLIQNEMKFANRAFSGSQDDVSYDANGFVASRIDRNGIETTYTHDVRGLETSRTEAAGTPRERTITTQWHATLRVPTLVTEPGATTAYTYNANGNVLTRTVTDTATSQSRVWTYTYDSYGRLLMENGPRSDVSDLTTYTYYTCTTGNKCGQPQTTKNALDQVTTFNTYNAHGQPLTLTDPNGVVTTLTYDLRTRLTSISRAGETTSFTYYPTGLLQRVTLPDTSYVEYTYDGAHRLTEVADGAGNRIVYSLDAMGNWTTENVYDPSSALSRMRSRVYNSLNQLWKELTATGSSVQTTVFGHDSEGNVTSMNAPLGRTTVTDYDELGRLQQVTDPMLGTTELTYDAADRVVSVLDPKSLATSYTYSGFGDLVELTSPDTGTTAMTYDPAGNLATQLDARSELATYSYDALNRVTQIAYGDETLAFTYDAGSNSKGRLMQVSDNSGTTTWSYTTAGRVSTKTQAMGAVTKSVSYGYDAAGALTTVTLPSGQVVTYTYANSLIASVKVGTTTILDSALYEPFGPIRQWNWGNGTLAARTHDLNGNVTQIDSAGLRSYSYDDARRITGIADAVNASLSQSYGYDASDRLTTATGSLLNQSWAYDPNGNRTAQSGSDASTYSVSSASNRLIGVTGGLTRNYTYDSSGNVTSDGNATFTYNDAGRMNSATKSAVTTVYSFNALGQRVKKSASGSSTYFIYDEAGQLIGEYDSSGALIQETVWLDNIPVATLRPNGGGVNIFYVHTDHVDTPRRVSRPSDNAVVWRWDSDPFGTTLASEDPDGDSALFVYNLRFAGQYRDSETGLHYNYFRDYDALAGRYLESDPIGLWGGVNTYAYVSGNPLDTIDPLGLEGPGPWNSPETLSSMQKNADPCVNAAIGNSLLNITPVVGLIKAFSEEMNSLDVVSSGATTAAAATAYAAGREAAASNARLDELRRFNRNRREQATLRRNMAADRGMRLGTKMLSRAFAGLGVAVEAANFAKAVEQCGCQQQ